MMKDETQNQSKSGKGPKPTNYDYDVFVSYRHLSDDSETHSIALARSITQAFQLEGFRVFFYCNNTEDAFRVIQENKSRYYIILVTRYSIETIEKYPYLTIEEIERGGRNDNGDGYNFAKEVYLIDKGIEAGEISKKNVLLFNVDKVFKKKRDIKTALLEHGFKFVGSQEYPWTEVIDFPTDERFTISNMINPDSDKGGEVKIKKSSRFSYERVKRIMQWVLIPILCLLIIAFAALWGVKQHAIVIQDAKIEGQNGEIVTQKNVIDGLIDSLSRIKKQYGEECIVFAGGGTVQKYLAKYKDIDVNNYTHYPSKYIHLPSAEAWSLLWDEITEDGDGRRYWPIVLSAEKLDDSPHIALLSSAIVEYKVGEIPLMVQIKDDFEEKSICLDELKKLLDNPSYAVHTTSDHSGTYNAYRQVLLSRHYDLDKLLKKKGRNVFTLSYYNTKAPGKTKDIFLGNELYNYQREPKMALKPVVYDAQTQDTVKIPLYVYAVATQKGSGNTNKRELCPQVKVFLYKIGCDTTMDITYNNNIVKMQSCE